MSCSYTFFTNPDLLPKIQKIVGKHNMRFDNNPAKFMNYSTVMVVVTGEGAQFSAGVGAISGLINSARDIDVEPKTSFWGSIKSLFFSREVAVANQE